MQFISEWTYPTVVEIVGLIFMAHYLIYVPLRALLGWLRGTCFPASKKILKPNPGDYAVVTGGTDGIGLEYARQLAEKGYNLMLLSRTEEKLKRVAQEIQKDYPQCRNVEIMAVDFSQVDIYEKICEKLEKLEGPVKVLVNNVGIMHPVPEYFTKYPNGLNLRMINCNIVSATAMTEMVLRMMTSQRPDHIRSNSKNACNGVIINISSSVSHHPIPLMSTYSASKVYVNYLSKILAAEYKADRIVVQCVTPGMVDTKLAKSMKANAGSWMAVPADSFVRNALRLVGTEEITDAHPKHKFIAGVAGAVGALLGEARTTKMILNMNLKTKKNAEKKVEPMTMDNPLRDENHNNNA